MASTLSARIPFCGFYESSYSRALDDEAEQLVENLVGGDADLDDYAPTLKRIRAAIGDDKLRETLNDALWRNTTWSIAQEQLAKEYAKEFGSWLSDSLDMELTCAFEEMTSPRYYNFETDRIFALIPKEAFAEIIRKLGEDEPEKLASTFRAMFTSRDGFISHYDNEVPQKPLDEWDHNELYAILSAWCDHQLEDWENISTVLYDWSIGGLYEKVGSAFDAAVNWEAFKENLEEAAAELIEEHEIELEEQPYRCPHTIDMFTGKTEEETRA